MRSLHQDIEVIYDSYVNERGAEKNIHPEYLIDRY
jgi:pyruvate dehydrogenase (quinone)